jgi:hypothetical protein
MSSENENDNEEYIYETQENFNLEYKFVKIDPETGASVYRNTKTNDEVEIVRRDFIGFKDKLYIPVKEGRNVKSFRKSLDKGEEYVKKFIEETGLSPEQFWLHMKEGPDGIWTGPEHFNKLSLNIQETEVVNQRPLEQIVEHQNQQIPMEPQQIHHQPHMGQHQIQGHHQPHMGQHQMQGHHIGHQQIHHQPHMGQHQMQGHHMGPHQMQGHHQHHMGPHQMQGHHQPHIGPHQMQGPRARDFGTHPDSNYYLINYHMPNYNTPRGSRAQSRAQTPEPMQQPLSRNSVPPQKGLALSANAALDILNRQHRQHRLPSVGGDAKKIKDKAKKYFYKLLNDPNTIYLTYKKHLYIKFNNYLLSVKKLQEYIYSKDSKQVKKKKNII